jgi:putative FmdB family regulatory protein
MPNYEHQCQNIECCYEWEEEYSIKADPPDTCPKCGLKTVKRLISLGGKGVVELTGRDLIEKCKADAQQMKKDIYNSEKLYSNMLGEAHYEKLQQRIDKQKRR